ncbi:MAG: DNA polymerase IV [Mycobacteriaceae bacterium]
MNTARDQSQPGHRWVLHVDMDAFFASVEQLTRPTLVGRPVLVGGTGGRGVVAGASYEARLFGARSAMPMHQARRLVGLTAVVLPPRIALYNFASRRVFHTIRQMFPVLEQLSFDEAFIEPVELAGVSVPVVEQFCQLLRKRILDETGLIASVGAGTGKQIAKIASGLAKPNGIFIVSRDNQAQLLADLPVRKLWGIGPVAGEKLHRLGVDTISDFARMSSVEVSSVLGGALGPSLHRLAQGEDDRPVLERSQAKQISAESTFVEDVKTLAELRLAVERSTEQAFTRLLRDGRGARTVSVKLKKTDMNVLSRSMTLPYPTIDKQLLSATAQRLVVDPQEIGPIRLVGIGFSGLAIVLQDSLFPDLDALSFSSDLENSENLDSDAALVLVREKQEKNRWFTGQDVEHPDHGHGWIQGVGHGVMTVRFETRSTGVGFVRSFSADEQKLQSADPLQSIDWPDFLIEG